MLTSCVVSKKKYDSLAASKKKSDSRANQLRKENTDLNKQLSKEKAENKKNSKQLESLKAEYNKIRNQMMANNAQKTATIDELNRQLATLSTDKSSLSDSLSAAIKRYQKKSDRLSSRSAEMQTELESLGAYQKVMSEYNERLNKLENTLQSSLNKYEIKGVAPIQKDGFIYLTFSGDALFDGDKKFTVNGKNTVKILSAVMKKYDYVHLDVAANWEETHPISEAWETTKIRAAEVFELILFNEVETIENFHISGAKILSQSLEGKTYASAIVLYPSLPLIEN